MECLKSFYENPFHVLGASPTDGRRKLIVLADDAALLGAPGADEALNRLMHHQARLDAEIGWFPATDPAQVAAALDAAGSADGAPLPDFRTDSALALFNACRALLERWPVEELEDAMALCKSLALADLAIRPEGTMEEINRDREICHFPALSDIGEIEYRLDNLRHAAAARLMERFRSALKPSMRSLMSQVAKLYRDLNSPLIEMLVAEDQLDVSAESDRLAGEIRLRAERLKAAQPSRSGASNAKELYKKYGIFLPAQPDWQVSHDLEEALGKLEEWDRLTQPGRTVKAAKGIVDESAKSLCSLLLDAGAHLQNALSLPSESLRVMQTLLKVFWDVTSLTRLLSDNAQKLKKILSMSAGARG